MPVKFEAMMRELFSAADRAAIRRPASGIARRHMALLELRQVRNRTEHEPVMLRDVGRPSARHKKKAA